VRYHNILRRHAGVQSETLALPAGARLREALEQMANSHGSHLRDVLFSPEGDIASHLVVFCNGNLVHGDRGEFALAEGDQLMLFPAISGG
jgi:molybdopterin converting factor small subunit